MCVTQLDFSFIVTLTVKCITAIPGLLTILFCMQNVYVQINNRNGSTVDPPVIVGAAVRSNMGSLLPQRLKQLAQTITGSSPAKNLGLNNSVFGKVKEISLSSFLNHTLDATPPTPSPAPAPEGNDYKEPSPTLSPELSPSHSPAPDFHNHLPPCFGCDASSPSDDNEPYSPSPENSPHHSFPPISSSPAPSVVGTRAPHPSHRCASMIPPSPSPTSNSDSTAPSADFSPHSYAPHVGPAPQLSPDLSPLPAGSHGSKPIHKGNAKRLASPPLESPSILPSQSCKLLLHICNSFIFFLLHPEDNFIMFRACMVLVFPVLLFQFECPEKLEMTCHIMNCSEFLQDVIALRNFSMSTLFFLTFLPCG